MDLLHSVVAVPRGVGVVVQLEVDADFVDLVPFEVLYAKSGRTDQGIGGVLNDVERRWLER